MLNSSLCDYSDAYKLVSGNITTAELAAGRRNGGIEESILKLCSIS